MEGVKEEFGVEQRQAGLVLTGRVSCRSAGSESGFYGSLSSSKHQSIIAGSLAMA